MLWLFLLSENAMPQWAIVLYNSICIIAIMIQYFKCFVRMVVVVAFSSPGKISENVRPFIPHLRFFV